MLNLEKKQMPLVIWIWEWGLGEKSGLMDNSIFSAEVRVVILRIKEFYKEGGSEKKGKVLGKDHRWAWEKEGRTTPGKLWSQTKDNVQWFGSVAQDIPFSLQM